MRTKTPRTYPAYVAAMVLWLAPTFLNTASAQSASTATAGQVSGVGNFLHIVANLDKSTQFYRDFLGLETADASGPRPYAVVRPPIADLYDAAAAEDRVAYFRLPATSMGVELIEFKNSSKASRKPSIEDPGATILTLYVRNLASILSLLKKGGIEVLTPGGDAVVVKDEDDGTRHVVFVRDPDGFFVQLVQPDFLSNVPLTLGDLPKEPAGNIFRGTLSMVVNDAEETMRRYHEALGLERQPTRPVLEGKIAMDVAATPGLYKRIVARVPGSAYEIDLLEFSGVTRKPVLHAVHDPGAAIFRFVTTDIDSLSRTLKRAQGFAIVSRSGAPSTVGSSRLFMALGPDNIFVELVQPMKAVDDSP